VAGIIGSGIPEALRQMPIMTTIEFLPPEYLQAQFSSRGMAYQFCLLLWQLFLGRFVPVRFINLYLFIFIIIIIFTLIICLVVVNLFGCSIMYSSCVVLCMLLNLGDRKVFNV
jgi:hypothetical protein